ncbi:NAD(P)/FAD-dependent oxidoreductase [Sagittula stellata]|uniref:Putative oxidoreductase protein n=1 Tax=Sagittula stellata (strain ATCC 700073 / DSM 11524 / E-37) TaxID=388399 RepID=A3K8N9_SAGS3|nr:FAD-dependent oxidoreductase [Sagittula stellata]EBA06477.1 putative oxidoreductase protein [Sagittula stellata E-37]
MADFLVLGAGMVGVSTALALQEQGLSVTLVDRKAAGRETSFGNAGIIQAEAAEPYALPRDPITLLRLALGGTNDVTWSLSGVAEMLPALWQYYRNSSPARHAKISHTYVRLTERSTHDHAPLIAEAGMEKLITRDGIAILYRDPDEYAAAVIDAERVHATYGTRFRAIDGAEYAREDPALLKAPAGVVHWQDSWSCASPGALTAGYADLFVRRGGTLLTGDAATLRQRGAGWQVETEAGAVDATQAVIALGPWSPRLLARLGYRIPMIYKRGYHGHFAAPRAPVRPFLDVAHGIVASPMTDGLRLATGAALVSKDSAADLRQLDRGRAGISDLIEIGARKDEPQWSGARPCLPDMLPLVGEAPRHKGLWMNFGHGHQGFTLGPTTGTLLAQMVAGHPNEGFEALLPSHRM